MKHYGYLLAFSLWLLSCGQKATKAPDTTVITTVITSSAPEFNSDSAYSYIASQTAFGPRVPNTQPHKACASWIASELERHGAKIYSQTARLTAYNGDNLVAYNIIGSFYPENERRILLCAHWDTRPFADHDSDPLKQRTPIDGADDGASGVGVLLELARHFGANNPNIGIDIIFFDAEDYGTPAFETERKQDTWCLGSQFWAKNPHVKGYKAEFGILLDMVGARGATFYKEYTSMRFASQYVEHIWTTARDLGYGRFFINAKGGAVIDDHQYVISGAHIPCLDIINYNNETDSGFGAHWHTLDDNIKIIDRTTLKAVGQTLLQTVYGS
jgi:hypothetical protein